MKKIFLLALCAASTFAGHAQATIGKGTGLLIGSVNYHTETDNVQGTGAGSNSSNSTTFGRFAIDAAVGWFVADNLALGLEVNHAVTGSSAMANGTARPTPTPTTTALRVGPFVQYYHMLSEQFGLTATLGSGYESDTRRALQYTPISGGPIYYSFTDVTGFYGALTPGIVFLPVPKFGLTASIGSLAFTRLKTKNDDPAGSNAPEHTLTAFDTGFGFSQLLLGGAFYFGRK